MKYSYGPYNKFDDKEQWIRITEGCPNNCPYCYEPQIEKIFPVPDIVRNDVKIMDMNLLCKEESLHLMNYLGEQKVNNKVVYYELICGIDYRFLTFELASVLKRNRFINIRLAWDYYLSHQKKVKAAKDMLLKAGYSPKEITVFMICNWKVPFVECCAKMDLCKVWNLKIADCYFDNQLSPNIKPIHWTTKEINTFRRRVRKHNQLVNFGIDPEYKTQAGSLF